MDVGAVNRDRLGIKIFRVKSGRGVAETSAARRRRASPRAGQSVVRGYQGLRTCGLGIGKKGGRPEEGNAQNRSCP